MKKALEKEWTAVLKKEEKLHDRVMKQKNAEWKENLEGKIPDKARKGLEAAFGKAFEIVFTKGTSVIEKSYQKEEAFDEHKIRDYAIRARGAGKDFRALKNTVRKSEYVNTAATFAEGVGLGLFGIGLPDIVLFVGMLLRGIYQIAAKYGYDTEDEFEKSFILKLMETSLQKGKAWEKGDEEAEAFVKNVVSELSEKELKQQIQETARIFAMDMLLLKFIQSLPAVGVVGGISNPFYYRKIMDYAELKYRKRYLYSLKEKEQGE
ncbi:MAG: EcsC family protein [Lachnospiraceae bacterium]|nr:EcsC family protein [Lachnospiraceae bacterium]